MLSIIMPCLNSEDFVQEAIENALGQSFKDFKLIIIDNGSKDRSRELIKSYIKDPRVKFLECKESGVSAARNTGIAAAKGKYLAFLDSDDIWYPQKLEKEINFLESHPEYMGSYSSVDYIDKNGVLLDKSYGKSIGYTGEIYMNLLQGNLIQNPSPILKTEAVKELGAFDEKLSYGEDWDLFIRLAYKGPFYYHPEALCAYRKHTEQTTQTHDVRSREEQALYLLEKNFKNLNCYIKKFSKLDLELPKASYKRIDTRVQTNTKKSITRAFKYYLSGVKEKDLTNPENFKKKALSNLYFRLAKDYKENFDKLNSKRCIKEALRLDPRRFVEPVSLKLLIS